jgi:MFS family permease
MQKNSISITWLGLLIWFIAAAFFLYEYFLRTFVGSIASQLIPDLHLSIEQFTLIGSAYFFAYGLMQMPVGVLADKFGVKKIMLFAVLVCAVATLLFSHSHSFANALASRFSMGLGSAFAFVCLLVLVSNWLPNQYFGFFAGVSQFIGTMGPVLAGGPLISWLVSSHIPWRSALTVVAYGGFVLALLVLLIIKNKPKGDSSKITYLTRDLPLKQCLMQIFKNKQAWVIAIYSASIYISLSVMAAVWGTNFLQAKGLSQQDAAYMISCAWIAYAIGCPLLGFLSDYFKRRKPVLVLCGLLGLISTCSMLYLHFHSISLYIVLFAMLGIAATGQNIGFATIIENATPDIKATALGFNNACIFLSATFLPLLISYMITKLHHHGSAGHIAVKTFVIALSVLPLLYLVSLIASIFLYKETYCRSQKSFVLLKNH